MIWLLDTNAVSVLLSRRNPSLIFRVESCLVSQLALCSVVKAELLYGAYHSPDPVRGLSKLVPLFQMLSSFSFDDAAAEEYGKLKAYLSRAGARIGPNDTLIAAITLANDLTLVTHNTAEFSRVPGLKLEDWQI